MSYSRWSSSCWYIFWHTSSGVAREEQVLCVWHHSVPGGGTGPFSYAEIRSALASDDWSCVTYRNNIDDLPEKEHLKECCEQWVQEMDRNPD